MPLRTVLLAVAVLLIAACGSSRPAPETAAAPAPAPATASGIPGLSVEELAALPPPAPLPGKLDKNATAEAIQAEAERLAQREARSGALNGGSAAQRALQLAHAWNEAVQVLRRGEPSVVPGLTIGELEDQPPGPSLPAIFDLRTTPADLEHHAWIVAMEERDQKLSGELPLDKRVLFLVWFWQKPLAERQAIEQAWVDRNRVRAEHRIAVAAQLAQYERDEQALQDRYDAEMLKVRMTYNPVLDAEQRAELDAMAEHYEFEEDYGNDKPFSGPVQ
jgi:hypothetical protein